MSNLNKVMLMGNMTRDCETTQLPSGTMVGNFGLAINRQWTKDGEKKEEVTFVDCTTFGRSAEVLAEYGKKGRALFVEGRLHMESWEDKTGAKRSKLSVIVESFQFVGAREGASAAPAQASPAPRPVRTPPPPPASRPSPQAAARRAVAASVGDLPRGGYQGEADAKAIADADLPF